MVLHLCGICEKETNLSGLTELDATVMERVHLSGMRFLYQQLINVKEDAKNCDIAYAQAVFDELTPDGIFKGAKFVCKVCVRQLPKLPKKKTNSITGDFEAEFVETSDPKDNENDVIDGDEDIGVEVLSDGTEVDVSDKDAGHGGVPDLAVVNGFFRGTLICSCCF